MTKMLKIDNGKRRNGLTIVATVIEPIALNMACVASNIILGKISSIDLKKKYKNDEGNHLMKNSFVLRIAYFYLYTVYKNIPKIF